MLFCSTNILSAKLIYNSVYKLVNYKFPIQIRIVEYISLHTFYIYNIISVKENHRKEINKLSILFQSMEKQYYNMSPFYDYSTVWSMKHGKQ